jgi:hypothetical protein
MNISFVICTQFAESTSVGTCVRSILDLAIPNYEIIVVGGSPTTSSSHFKHISFDENIKPGWITKKKNLGAKLANYNNLVIMHDYFTFDYDWYANWLEFSKQNTWDVASNPILGVNNQRIYTDWTTYDHPRFKKGFPLPYNDWSNTRYQYISGGYFLVKKSVFLDNLLDENLLWNQEEDVDWSLRIRDNYKIVCNSKSIVRHTKWHLHLNRWKKNQKKFKKVFGNDEWKN